MIVGSTFSGVGGIDLGLERAGMRVVWNAESDEWCRGVLRHHWPLAEQYADVCDVAQGAEGARPGRLRTLGAGNGSGHALDARPRPAGVGVDLLCGGFPCQDLSVAGKRRGLAGARSGLFHEFARIADALQPRWLLIENVPGLLSSNDGRDFGVVLHTLAELGYGVAWRVLDSRYFGVPQRRRRVFIVARAGGDHASALRALCESCPGSPPAGECSWQGAPTRARAGTNGNGGTVSTLQGAPGRGYRVDAEGAAGGHLVPQTFTFQPDDGGEFTGADARKSERGVRVVVEGVGVRRLTPRECERLQGFPDDWTLIPNLKCPDSRRYAAMGNAVTVNVANWIGNRIMAVDARG